MSDEQQAAPDPQMGTVSGEIPTSHGDVLTDNTGATILIRTDRHSLREWWHEILRVHGRYSCYAIFLTLPSDMETLRYLTEYSKELDLISGKNCLVIALSKTGFQRPGIDHAGWRTFIEAHTREGHSVVVAKLFGIEFTEFPCLLIFEDIRSPEHVAIKLTRMTAADIATRMRLIFAIIDISIQEKKNPLEELEKQQSLEVFQKRRQSIGTKVGGLLEKTFETAMEAWINATIK
jgi:hypothetical protein